jgi:hypothetical protein
VLLLTRAVTPDELRRARSAVARKFGRGRKRATAEVTP